RLDLAVADQFDGMAAAAQRVARRTRLQPRDHAGDLAGADIERRHQRGALLRHRTRLRRLSALEAAHALPAFFFLSLNSSSRAFAASSDSRTVSRSGNRMSIATMSRENSRSSRSSFVSAASALPTSFSGSRTSRPSFNRRFQRRSPTNTAAFMTERTFG